MLIKSYSSNLLILVYCTLWFRDIFVKCVRITEVSPLQFIESGTGNVVLDCQFEIDEQNDKMLVLKWYHRGDPIAIYQWILSKDSRKYSDKIEPFVDKDYSVDDKLTHFRAIRLINPPSSLSGVYECNVQSVDSHDTKTTELIIYVKAKSFYMNATEVENGVNITCTATGLYPEPKLSLFRITSSNESNSINAIEVKDKTTVSVTREQSGHYTIVLTSQIYEDSYSGRIDVTEHYECRLLLENSDYVETKNIAIQSGWHTRPHPHNTNNNNFKAPTVVLLFLPLLAVINIICRDII